MEKEEKRRSLSIRSSHSDKSPNSFISASSNTSSIEPASARRNDEFHQLFRSVPEDDELIDDYSCALHREILIQGRLYLSRGHICFNSNILGWVTNLVVSLEDVLSVDRKMTAFLFPNAIQITTIHSRFTFASFIHRETVFKSICSCWKKALAMCRNFDESIDLQNGRKPAKRNPKKYGEKKPYRLWSNKRTLVEQFSASTANARSLNALISETSSSPKRSHESTATFNKTLTSSLGRNNMKQSILSRHVLSDGNDTEVELSARSKSSTALPDGSFGQSPTSHQINDIDHQFSQNLENPSKLKRWLRARRFRRSISSVSGSDAAVSRVGSSRPSFQVDQTDSKDYKPLQDESKESSVINLSSNSCSESQLDFGLLRRRRFSDSESLINHSRDSFQKNFELIENRADTHRYSTDGKSQIIIPPVIIHPSSSHEMYSNGHASISSELDLENYSDVEAFPPLGGRKNFGTTPPSLDDLVPLPKARVTDTFSLKINDHSGKKVSFLPSDFNTSAKSSPDRESFFLPGDPTSLADNFITSSDKERSLRLDNDSQSYRFQPASRSLDDHYSNTNDVYLTSQSVGSKDFSNLGSLNVNQKAPIEMDEMDSLPREASIKYPDTNSIGFKDSVSGFNSKNSQSSKFLDIQASSQPPVSQINSHSLSRLVSVAGKSSINDVESMDRTAFSWHSKSTNSTFLQSAPPLYNQKSFSVASENYRSREMEDDDINHISGRRKASDAMSEITESSANTNQKHSSASNDPPVYCNCQDHQKYIIIDRRIPINAGELVRRLFGGKAEVFPNSTGESQDSALSNATKNSTRKLSHTIIDVTSMWEHQIIMNGGKLVEERDLGTNIHESKKSENPGNNPNVQNSEIFNKRLSEKDKKSTVNATHLSPKFAHKWLCVETGSTEYLNVSGFDGSATVFAKYKQDQTDSSLSSDLNSSNSGKSPILTRKGSRKYSASASSGFPFRRIFEYLAPLRFPLGPKPTKFVSQFAVTQPLSHSRTKSQPVFSLRILTNTFGALSSSHFNLRTSVCVMRVNDLECRLLVCSDVQFEPVSSSSQSWVFSGSESNTAGQSGWVLFRGACEKLGIEWEAALWEGIFRELESSVINTKSVNHRNSYESGLGNTQAKTIYNSSIFHRHLDKASTNNTKHLENFVKYSDSAFKGSESEFVDENSLEDTIVPLGSRRLTSMSRYFSTKLEIAISFFLDYVFSFIDAIMPKVQFRTVYRSFVDFFLEFGSQSSQPSETNVMHQKKLFVQIAFGIIACLLLGNFYLVAQVRFLSDKLQVLAPSTHSYSWYDESNTKLSENDVLGFENLASIKENPNLFQQISNWKKLWGKVTGLLSNSHSNQLDEAFEEVDQHGNSLTPMPSWWFLDIDEKVQN